MRFFQVLSLIGVVLLISACGGSKKATVSADRAQMSSEEMTVFIEEVLNTGTAYAYNDMITRLGPPVRVRTRAMADGNDSADSLRTAVYYGLEFSYYESNAPRRTFLAGLALTDARYVTPEGLRVGLAQAYISDYLGKPTREESTQLFYERTEPVPLQIVVTLEQRAVSHIAWEFEYQQ